MIAVLRETVRGIASLVYPPTCVVCSAAVEPGEYLCPYCTAAAPLADFLAGRTGLLLDESLERIRYTSTQTSHDRAERMRNLQDAFRLRKKANVRGLRVLLIDDVLTTGSTLSECARVLRSAG